LIPDRSHGHEFVACQAPGRRDRFHQGRHLFHRGRRPDRPGSGRRHLVAASDYRAP